MGILYTCLCDIKDSADICLKTIVLANVSKPTNTSRMHAYYGIMKSLGNGLVQLFVLLLLIVATILNTVVRIRIYVHRLWTCKP